MNARQRAFAEHYARHGNAAEAARAAGYSERTARTQGQRMLTNVDIQNFITELQSRLSSERIADAREVREKLTEILRNDEERTGYRIRAADVLLKAGGAYLPAPKEETSKQKTSKEDRELAEMGISSDADRQQCEVVMPWDGKSVIDGILEDDGTLTRLIDVNPDGEGQTTIVLTREQASKLGYD